MAQFITDNFWLILVVLLMFTYNKRYATLLATVCYILKPTGTFLENAIIVVYVVLSLFLMTNDSYKKKDEKKDYKAPDHDPDYD